MTGGYCEKNLTIKALADSHIYHATHSVENSTLRAIMQITPYIFIPTGMMRMLWKIMAH